MDDILSAVINFDTDAEKVIETSIAFIRAEVENPGNVKFDDEEAENGEPSIVEGYDFGEKTVFKEMDIVLSGIDNLKGDMSGERFLEQLNHFDLSELPDIR